MPSLGATTARLARLKKEFERQSAGSADDRMTELRGFGFNPGALRLMAYVPADLPRNAPLVVVLHGCGQTAAAYARAAGWLTLADRLGFAVLAPEQSRENNANGCFNWFEPGDTRRGAGEAASIHAMVQHMVRTHELDEGRVFVTGLSAGGAMTSVMLATYPDTFAAGAVVAGLPYGVAANVQQAFAAMRGANAASGRELGEFVARAAPARGRRPRLTVWHGLADGTVASSNAHALAHQWAAVHGLAEQPDKVLSRTGWTRALWNGPDGEVLVETNLLGGLGHGAPVAAGGQDPIGEVAPYVLEAGVSSSLEIARFWGLAPQEPWSSDGAAPDEAASGGGLADPAVVGERVMAAISPHVPGKVEAVIAGALRKAGLMP